MSDSGVGSLENEALKRKERLKALKKGELKTLSATDSNSDEGNKDEALFPKPIFRNYNPKDESLKSGVLPKPKLIEIEDEIKEKLESGKPTPLIEKEIDLTTLAPQKIDWDLKRDTEKRLKILEKRTQRAIVELIKERLRQQKNADLAELVSLGSTVKKETNDEDEDDDDENNDEEGKGLESDSPMTSQEFINDKREISDDDDY